MIYYPLSTMMLAGIKDILIICKECDKQSYWILFEDGKHLGCNISYEIQDKPNGIAEAFLIGENFIGDDSVCLMLGDNIFYGNGLSTQLQDIANTNAPYIFAYEVSNPYEFGVVEFEGDDVITIEEKPDNPKSNWIIPGIYFYPNKVIEITKTLRPSERGELEISDINRKFLDRGTLKVNKMNRGTVWYDTGSIENLNIASDFMKTIEHSTGKKIACIEEVAYKMGYIT